MRLSEALRNIINNPDDLSTLPQLVELAEKHEADETSYLERIAKLQEINKSYLSQIPIASNEPPKIEEPQEPTLEDAKNYLIEQLGGK